MIARDYAKALYELGEAASLANLRAALVRRGHEQLLPRIYAEYAKLVLRAKRSADQRATTPEKERTRILLELYKKLATSN